MNIAENCQNWEKSQQEEEEQEEEEQQSKVKDLSIYSRSKISSKMSQNFEKVDFRQIFHNKYHFLCQNRI